MYVGTIILVLWLRAYTTPPANPYRFRTWRGCYKEVHLALYVVNLFYKGVYLDGKVWLDDVRSALDSTMYASLE